MAMAGPGVGEDCDVVFGCESDVFLSMFVGDPDSNKSSMVGGLGCFNFSFPRW